MKTRIPLIAAFLVVGVIRLHAATITVTSAADSGAGTLRAALASAANGDTIDITGVSGSILLTSGELLVTNSLTILGPGPANLAVNGNAAGRVFHIGSNTVVSVFSLTITNGLTPCCDLPASAGAGILNDHGTLTVINCTFAGNSAAGNGGGIFNNSSDGSATLTISHCTLSGNSATNGGGIAISDRDYYVMITDTTLSGNLATNGGGVFIGGSPGIVTITDSTLSGNLAANGGGIFNSSGYLTITNSVLSSNSATSLPGEGFGGGIYNDAGVLFVNSSLLSNNSANGEGGGIYTIAEGPIGGSVQINDSTLSGNSATNFYGSGGGIFSAGVYGGSTWVFVENSTVSDNLNTAIWNIANDGSRAQLVFINSTLSGNIGGGIENQGYNGGSVNLTILSSTLSGNSGDGIYSYGIDYGGSVTLAIGNTILNAVAPGKNINGYGSVTNISDGYNLSSDDGSGVLTNTTDQINTNPKLGPLQNNGGPTFTHALLPGSPAINKGKNLSSVYGTLFTDQRGQPRVFDDPDIANASGGDGTDIGAYEAINLRITALQKAGNDLQLSFTSGAGGKYVVESRSDLLTGRSHRAAEIVQALYNRA